MTFVQNDKLGKNAKYYYKNTLVWQANHEFLLYDPHVESFIHTAQSFSYEMNINIY